MMSELRRGGKPVAFVLDDKLIGTTGLDVVTMLREEGYDEPIIFLSSNKDIQRSVDIVRQGVESYIVKGEDCIEQLEDCLYKLN